MTYTVGKVGPISTKLDGGGRGREFILQKNHGNKTNVAILFANLVLICSKHFTG